MQCEKMGRIISQLIRHYLPFTLLSKERTSEVADIIRVIELKDKEIIQMRSSLATDYLFVVEGSVEVIKHGEIHTLCGPKDVKNRPFLLPNDGTPATVVASTDAVIAHADREKLDELISWDEMVHITDQLEGDEEVKDFIHLIRNSLVFNKLPLEYYESAVKRMHHRPVQKDEYIVRQGDEADAYYVIIKGTAAVWSMGLYDDEPVRQDDLGPGDTFGGLALVAGGNRNRTVQMLSDGELMVLDKKDFEELVAKPLVKTVTAKVAKSMMEDEGRELIDVRYVEEYEDHHIPQASLLPLHELKDRMDELDKDKKYIIHCHAGSRSAMACLILTKNGYDVLSLEGGIRDWPYDMVGEGH